MQVALVEGNETVVAKIHEQMDIVVVANMVPNGTDLMQRVLEDRKDDRMQMTEKLFDVARARQVKEAKDMRVIVAVASCSADIAIGAVKTRLQPFRPHNLKLHLEIPGTRTFARPQITL